MYGRTLAGITGVIAASIASVLGAPAAAAAPAVDTAAILALPKLSILPTTPVGEGNGGSAVVPFTLTLSVPAPTDVTVTYQTLDGTATVAGDDYVPASGTVTIPIGLTTAVVPVTVIGDPFDEPSEVFTFKVMTVTGASGLPSKQQKINDDDPTPTLSVDDVTADEGTLATFTVGLSAPSGQTVTVRYATRNRSTTAGDLQAATGTLTFLVGETTKQVLVPVQIDGRNEIAETFRLTLSSPVGATIADGLGIATIPANVT